MRSTVDLEKFSLNNSWMDLKDVVLRMDQVGLEDWTVRNKIVETGLVWERKREMVSLWWEGGGGLNIINPGKNNPVGGCQKSY